MTTTSLASLISPSACRLLAKMKEGKGVSACRDLIRRHARTKSAVSKPIMGYIQYLGYHEDHCVEEVHTESWDVIPRLSVIEVN